jgi:hypothetical protein
MGLHQQSKAWSGRWAEISWLGRLAQLRKEMSFAISSSSIARGLSENFASGSRDGNSEIEVYAMTLVLTVKGDDSIWLLADRRLSYKDRAPKDDARKVMFLDTPDGVAILGYAGLGETAGGTEPSDWISSVLRGRNLPMEQSLDVLAEAVKNQFPPHLRRLRERGAPPHYILATAFLGNEARLYTIDLAFAPDRKSYDIRLNRRVVNKPISAPTRTPTWAVAGSGQSYLRRDLKWKRPLLCMVRAYECGRVSPFAVAGHLASLNYAVHLGVGDNTVGPRCIVAWRNRKGGIHKEGGRHRFYTGTTREANTTSLPAIANGRDVKAIVDVLMPHTIKASEAMRAGEPVKDLDDDELKAEFARLPDEPDEHLL